MDIYGVRRKDTTKGPPLRVLSLDGGGVRGYSMLIIIQEIMHRTFVETEGRAPRRHEIPRPCDQFDLIVGTGTGGLIALMLGRLRLDLETCKELYVRLARMVFETDKTIAGIPYRSTLFKASKLEDAIKQCVREYTTVDKAGNDRDEIETNNSPIRSSRSNVSYPQRYSSNASTISFSARSQSGQMAPRPMLNSRPGNANARLYDARENRTKTAVTAIYKGSAPGTPPALLRSYDSRREPAPEFDCRIWQAGRATCAIGLAFKPIQIGQSIFHDDGVGTFNPAPEALDEAIINEWPGREIGVFVSVGTGKRPRTSDTNQHMWYEGFLGDFAEARRRLIAKIEGCETIHEYMLREHLVKRGVNAETYYRLNVEIGVGEFGMNEWHRLGDISTGTRRYMAQEREQKMMQGISAKLARILKARSRWERTVHGIPVNAKTTSLISLERPLAVELPGDLPPPWNQQASHSSPSRSSFESGSDSLPVAALQISSDRPRPGTGHSRSSQPPKFWLPPLPPPPDGITSPRADGNEWLLTTAPMQSSYRHSLETDKLVDVSVYEQQRPVTATTKLEEAPPPLPPKTPLPVGNQRPHYEPYQVAHSHDSRRKIPRVAVPPYPVDDELPPPPVNMARKPEYRVK